MPSNGTLKRCFQALRAANRTALIPYLTAGYPSREATLEALLGIVAAGSDVVELGIPFSDPIADGPTIQRATFEALRAGMTVEGTLQLLRDFRSHSDTPVVLFTYVNPLLHYGVEAFVQAATEGGAQGLLLTDVPAGADAALEVAFTSTGLDLIRLVAPTTPPQRFDIVARGGGGFLYYISRTGVTGAREELRAELTHEVERLRAAASLPVAVGFGISTPAQAAAVARVADGVVVGSALIKALDEGGTEGAGRFIASLREEMDR